MFVARSVAVNPKNKPDAEKIGVGFISISPQRKQGGLTLACAAGGPFF
jgi:hypothetical protein